MSANIKCYDPATGGVLFDLSKSTTRILHEIAVAPNSSGAITISEQGQLFAFPMVQTVAIDTMERDGFIMISSMLIEFDNRTVRYRNLTNYQQTLWVGVTTL